MKAIRIILPICSFAVNNSDIKIVDKIDTNNIDSKVAVITKADNTDKNAKNCGNY